MKHDPERLVQIARAKMAEHGHDPLSEVEELRLRQIADAFNRLPSREELLTEARFQWLREFACPEADRWSRNTYHSPPPPAPAPRSCAAPARAFSRPTG